MTCWLVYLEITVSNHFFLLMSELCNFENLYIPINDEIFYLGKKIRDCVKLMLFSLLTYGSILDVEVRSNGKMG